MFRHWPERTGLAATLGLFSYLRQNHNRVNKVLKKTFDRECAIGLMPFASCVK